MKLAHVALWTPNLERLRAFYERHFGARSGERYHNPTKQFTSYFLRFDGDDEATTLEIMSHPALALSDSGQGRLVAGYAHIALSVGSRERVDELTAALRAAGVSVVDGPRTKGDGYYESVVLDPDGNRVELTV